MSETTQETTETKLLHYFFTTDEKGEWTDENGRRYAANAGQAFHTPQGLNFGCPQATTAAEAAAMKGLTYDPLPPETEAAEPASELTAEAAEAAES